jgi:hypothetical protein
VFAFDVLEQSARHGLDALLRLDQGPLGLVLNPDGRITQVGHQLIILFVLSLARVFCSQKVIIA